MRDHDAPDSSLGVSGSSDPSAKGCDLPDLSRREEALPYRRRNPRSARPRDVLVGRQGDWIEYARPHRGRGDVGNMSHTLHRDVRLLAPSDVISVMPDGRHCATYSLSHAIPKTEPCGTPRVRGSHVPTKRITCEDVALSPPDGAWC